MKSTDYQPRIAISDTGFYRETFLSASDLEAAEYTLQMIADLGSPERELQFLRITLALESGKFGGNISSRS